MSIIPDSLVWVRLFLTPLNRDVQRDEWQDADVNVDSNLCRPPEQTDPEISDLKLKLNDQSWAIHQPQTTRCFILGNLTDVLHFPPRVSALPSPRRCNHGDQNHHGVPW